MNEIDGSPTVASVLDAVDRLPVDDRRRVFEAMRRRDAAAAHDRLVEEVEGARREFQSGSAQPMSAAEIAAEWD